MARPARVSDGPQDQTDLLRAQVREIDSLKAQLAAKDEQLVAAHLTIVTQTDEIAALTARAKDLEGAVQRDGESGKVEQL